MNCISEDASLFLCDQSTWGSALRSELLVHPVLRANTLNGVVGLYGNKGLTEDHGNCEISK